MKKPTQITKKQFLKDVKYEIDNLKKHATDTEKSRLNFYAFDPEGVRDCIYGQMTGDCKSHRASELIGLCCRRVVVNYGKLDSFETILPVVNGKFDKDSFNSNRGELLYLSSLEGYIFAEEAKNEDVINYLRGYSNTLSL